MAHVEELPTGFDAAMALKPTPSPKPSPVTPSPANAVPPKSSAPRNPSLPSAALPPIMESNKQHTADELIAILNRTPLFMTELDESDGAEGTNVELDALKALAYEGTRVEIAGGFKERGNECAKAKQWVDARAFYGQALAALKAVAVEVPDMDLGAEEERDEEADKIKEAEIEEACHVNRALCNLELKNYGSCNKDCAACLRINPRNVKAFYRSASACMALDKLDAAADACTHALAVDSSNAAAKALNTKIDARRIHLEREARLRAERLQRERAEVYTLKQAMVARGIATRMTDQAPADAQDAKLALDDPMDPSSNLSVPTLLLYPTAAQSDLIKAFNETETLLDHLGYILPCPWDKEGEFTMAGVECYMDTVAGGLIKVGKKLSLLKVISGGKVEIVDGLCRIYVVPKHKTTEWVAEVKRRKLS